MKTRAANRAQGAKVSVSELMLRPDVHGRRRPEDLEVLELAYRMRRRVAHDTAPAPAPRPWLLSPIRVVALVAGLLTLSGVIVLVSV